MVRTVAGVFSLVGVLGFGWLALSSSVELLRFPATPRRVTLAQALAGPEDQYAWVELTDAQWRCDQQTVTRRASSEGDSTRLSYVPIARPGEAVLLISESHDLGCPPDGARVPRGVIQPTNARDARRLRTEGIDPPAHLLCSYCGRGNSLLGIVVAGVLAAAAASVYALVMLLRPEPQ
jgi:hypothetical protein